MLQSGLRVSTTAPAGLDFVWREAVRLIDTQLRQAADLDAKASTLVAFATAILALLVARQEVLGHGDAVLIVELLAAIAYLLLSFSLRHFGTAPALPALALWTEDQPYRIEDAFLGSLVTTYRANQRSLAAKAVFFRAAVYAIIAFAATGGPLLLFA